MDDQVRLRHILDAARQAVKFSQGRSRNDLEVDAQLSLALVRLLEIIGEAAKHISPEFCAKYPDIPWKKMCGTRDRLIHGYFDVNHDAVWETVTRDLPPLIASLEPLVLQNGGES